MDNQSVEQTKSNIITNNETNNEMKSDIITNDEIKTNNETNNEMKSNIITNNKTNDIIADKLKKMYGTRKHLLTTIIKMYKFMESEQELLSKSDIQDDVAEAKFDLNIDRFIKESYAEILNTENKNLFVNNKVKMLPAYLDFCYLYYVHSFDDNAPFYNLPKSVFKYRVINSTLHVPDEDLYANINNCFEDIINTPIISDMCREIPPYYMRTELSTDEIDIQLREVILPKCKKILSELIKILQLTKLT